MENNIDYFSPFIILRTIITFGILYFIIIKIKKKLKKKKKRW